MQTSPSSLYLQSIDKQRIVVAGESKARITEMISFIVKENNRKIDLSTSLSEQIADSPTLIVEANDNIESLKEFHPHILVLSPLDASKKDAYLSLADALPKSGGIFYDESDTIAKQIAIKERPDVTIIPYALPKYEMNSNGAVLISSTSEKFQTRLTRQEDLKSSSAAKELLKKIGISSGQFYRAISKFN